MVNYEQFKEFKKILKENNEEILESFLDKLTDIRDVELGDCNSFANDRTLK